MTVKEKKLFSLTDTSVPIIDPTIPIEDYILVDLSVQNRELSAYDIKDPDQCQAFIDLELQKKRAKVAYGGYLEERNLYQNSPNFTAGDLEARNIHLGLDIWARANTPVLAPLNGKVHSFADNSMPGDYGPTIILSHHTAHLIFYTIYGHLSRTSLEPLETGQPVQGGETIAFLGIPEENGRYAPHLHFQIIMDLEGCMGDYPGVCTRSALHFYQKNCPNPNLLLKI